MTRQVSDEQVADMLRRRWSGDTFDEIAAAHGFPYAGSVLTLLRGQPAPSAQQVRVARSTRRFCQLEELFAAGHDLQSAVVLVGLSVPVALKLLRSDIPRKLGVRTAEQKALFAALTEKLAAGYDVCAAAAAAGVLEWQARALMARAGISLPKATAVDQETRDRNERVVARRAAGATLGEIGTEFGLTRERVRQIVRRAGGPTRRDVSAVNERARLERLDVLGDQVGRLLAELGPVTAQIVRERLGCTSEDLRAAIRDSDRRLLIAKSRSTAGRSDEEVGVGLRRVSALRAKRDGEQGLVRISGEYWNAHRDPARELSAVRLVQRFGSWSEACRRAGLPVGKHDGRPGPPQRFDDQACLAVAKEFLVDPTAGVSYAAFAAWMRARPDAPSAQTVRSRLGSWNQIRRLAAAGQG